MDTIPIFDQPLKRLFARLVTATVATLSMVACIGGLWELGEMFPVIRPAPLAIVLIGTLVGLLCGGFTVHKLPTQWWD